MGAELLIALEAEQDLAEAYEWYEHHRIGLGEEFLSRVDACIQGILRNPEMHPIVHENYRPIVHENYRRGLVRRFPYGVFYEIAENVVTVYCIFHTSRDHAKWRRRLS